MIDAELIMSEAQTVGVAQATINSTNTIDMRVEGIGPGTPVRAVARMREGLNSAGAVTLTVKVVSAHNNSNWVEHHTSRGHLKADAVAGFKILDFMLPKEVQRYVKLTYTLGAADPTGGTIDAYLTLE